MKMPNETDIRPWEMLHELAGSGDARRLHEYVESLAPSEAVRAIFRLNPEEREKVLTTLTPAEAADLIEDMPDEHAADIIEQLPASDAASILNEMQSDDQADVLGELDAPEAEAILAEMEPEDAHDARRLIAYPEDVAGGVMVTEFLSHQENTEVGAAIDELSVRAEREEEYFAHYVYVVSAWGTLVGVLSVRDLVLSRRSAPLADVMGPPLFVTDETPLDELKDFFNRHDFYGVPVVSKHGRLLGVTSRKAVFDAISERAEQDRMKMQGIIGGDEIRTLPVAVRSRRRLSWLSLNIVLNMIAASIIALYQDTLAAVIMLAVFLPIVSDMSGCSGNQAIAVSMRELSLGLIKPAEAFRVWTQELSVGVINGLVLGFMLGAAAWLWKGNPYLGLVVGGALAVNTVVSVSIGGTVPLLLKRIGRDPAIASGPILTTITDMFGFFLVLSLATIALPLLTVQ